MMTHYRWRDKGGHYYSTVLFLCSSWLPLRLPSYEGVAFKARCLFKSEGAGNPEVGPYPTGKHLFGEGPGGTPRG